MEEMVSRSVLTERKGAVMTQLEHEVKDAGLEGRGQRVHVLVRIIGHEDQAFESSVHATLLEMMAEAARLGGFALLPPKERPFDRLQRLDGEAVGPVIENLDQTMGEFLDHFPGAAHFAIEVARTLRVNKRWDVASTAELTPLEILALPRIHLDPAEYSLYLPDSTEPLPPDKPVKIERGQDFEAQCDGRYGRDQ